MDTTTATTSPLEIGGEEQTPRFSENPIRHAYGTMEHSHPGYNDDITEPEGEALHALRLWTFAQVNPKLRLELRTWDTLQLGTELSPEEFTSEYLPGAEDEDEGAALLTAAVDACREYLAYKERQRIAGGTVNAK